MARDILYKIELNKDYEQEWHFLLYTCISWKVWDLVIMLAVQNFPICVLLPFQTISDFLPMSSFQQCVSVRVPRLTVVSFNCVRCQRAVIEIIHIVELIITRRFSSRIITKIWIYNKEITKDLENKNINHQERLVELTSVNSTSLDYTP